MSEEREVHWYETINEQVEKLDPKNIIEPKTPIQPGDHVLSEIVEDESLKKLYTLFKEYSLLLDKLTKAIAMLEEPSEEALSIVEEFAYRANILQDLFFEAICAKHKLWNKDEVHVRKGWKIAWRDDSGIIPLAGGFTGLEPKKDM